MHDIFVSHIRDDAAEVARLVNALRAQRLDLWWDGDLNGGDRFAEQIEAELDSARCVIVCWSRGALRGSDWIRGEAERARARTRVVSVVLDGTPAPQLPVPFNMLQAIDLSLWDGSDRQECFQRLLASVSEEANPGPRRKVAQSKRRALLLGVSACPDFGVPALPAVKNNVDELGKVLKRPECGFEVTRCFNLDKQELETAIEQFFGSAASDELLVFYFSGHAALTEAKTLHLLARNSKSTLRSTTIALSRIEEDALRNCKAAQILFVLDCCYGSSGKEDVAAALQTPLGAGRSLVVLGTQPDAEGGIEPWKEGTSPLTALFIASLDSDAADRNGDGIVTADEISRYIAGTNADAAFQWAFRASPSEMFIRQGQGKRTDALPAASEQRNFVSALLPQFEQGQLVPFLGDGIYGTGPLSFFRVAQALVARAGLAAEKRQDLIATAAESLEMHLEDRSEFLSTVGAVFEEQCHACPAPPPVYEMITKMKPPWLVITVNYDDLLERSLVAAGRSFVVVTHVLRSGNEEDDNRNEFAGKILVTRSPQDPAVKELDRRQAELLQADEPFLADDDCVIYKLLGSPFLGRLPFVAERKLDTVVMTESDHVDFLVHLRDERTGVPAAIRRRIHTRKLLFLEYNLDVWHYRLIGHLFRRHAQGRPGCVPLKKTPYRLRTAASPTEELFWQRRFSPDVVPMDLTTFVRAVRASSG